MRPDEKLLSSQICGGKTEKQPSPVAKKDNKIRRYLGFGPDLTFLGLANSWIGLCYVLSGIAMATFHVITYSWTGTTMRLECHEDRCWTVQKEQNQISHVYNLLKNSKFLYNDPKVGLWFGIFAIAYGLLSGLRFTRVVVNLGYMLNAILFVSSVFLLTIAIFEIIVWSDIWDKEITRYFWIRMRSLNDLIMIILILGLSFFQLWINGPHVQFRSVSKIGPVLTYMDTKRRPSKILPPTGQAHYNIRL